jgi:hypothetical protein
MKLPIYVDEAEFYLQIKKSKERIPSRKSAKLTLILKGKKFILIRALTKHGIIMKI